MNCRWNDGAALPLVRLTRMLWMASLVFSTDAFQSVRSVSGGRQQQPFIPLTRWTAHLAAVSGDEGANNVVVGPADEIFQPKLLDGVKFNLFGIGRQPDEDENGVFQPPPDSMNDKVVLITGASSGLGLESAKRLALSGASVVLTARTDDKVIASVKAVKDYCIGIPNMYGKTGSFISGAFINMEPNVRGVSLDLDDLSSVRSFPARYRECMQDDNDGSIKKIDVLMNNAGGGGHPSRELTIDGYEKTFQSCHLGPFLLTARLFEDGLLNDHVKNGCTVINVSSVSHRCAVADHSSKDDNCDDSGEVEYGYDFDNTNCEVYYSNGADAYFQGKLGNILFTKELQRRANLRKKNWLNAVSLEPGGVVSDIWRHSLGYDPRNFQERCDNNEMIEQPANHAHRSFAERLKSQIFYRLATQVERGSNAQIWLAYVATSGGDDDNGAVIQGGQHYDEYRTAIPVPEYAQREETTRRLWDMSEKMAGITFDLS